MATGTRFSGCYRCKEVGVVKVRLYLKQEEQDTLKFQKKIHAAKCFKNILSTYRQLWHDGSFKASKTRPVRNLRENKRKMKQSQNTKSLHGFLYISLNASSENLVVLFRYRFAPTKG